MLGFSSKPYKLGIVLSGGGARGFAHCGALLAFEEMGIRPDIMAGVSAGSIVTALYASGMRPREILEAFADVSFTDFAELSIPRDGFFSMDGFRKFLRKHIPYTDISEFPLPIVICATDMNENRPAAFREGNVVDCVAASCSIPIVFKPVKIKGVPYVDGGVLANLPAWAAPRRVQIPHRSQLLPRASPRIPQVDSRHRPAHLRPPGQKQQRPSDAALRPRHTAQRHCTLQSI